MTDLPDTLEPNRMMAAIDLNWLTRIHWHATESRDDTVAGVVRTVYELATNPSYHHLACAMDCDGPTFRHALYPEYKGNRQSTPTEYYDTLYEIKRVLGSMGILVLQVPAYEADDILFTISRRCIATLDTKCVLVSGDKDLRQCLEAGWVTIRTKHKGEWCYHTLDFAEMNWKVKREQFVDWRCLVGDTSDNIKGLTGIGEVKASNLLQRYQTIEDVVAGESFTGKTADDLPRFMEELEVTRKVTRLNGDIPLPSLFSESSRKPEKTRYLERVLDEVGNEKLVSLLA